MQFKAYATARRGTSPFGWITRVLRERRCTRGDVSSNVGRFADGVRKLLFSRPCGVLVLRSPRAWRHLPCWAWQRVGSVSISTESSGAFRAKGAPQPRDSVDGGSDGPAEAGIPSVPIEQIGMGSNYGCGRRTDGSVMCWGATDVGGELGDGLQIASSTPVLAKDVLDAADVSVGQHHVCVARRGGTVSCWGYNEFRQLGDGTTNDSPTAKDVVALTDVTHVAVGYAHSCALKKDATVQCWGDNTSGQLGDGTVVPRSQPAPVMGLADVTQIASATSTTCALLKSGEVMCWGKNDVGQASVMPPTAVQVPVKVAGLTGVTMLAAGSQSEHFCAVTATDVRCWGAGGNGQLGNAKSDDGPTPVAALGINDAVGVAAGGRHSCAWRKNGTVSCWGHNAWRQLGLGDSATSDDVSSPVSVNGLADVKQIAAGSSHTCALSTDGAHINCWGTNVSGALGRGTRVTSALPLKVSVSGTLAGFAMGDSHSCAFDSAGALSCWGDNGYRQLGVDAFQATGTPTPVPGIAGVTHAAAGDIHTCAVVAGGAVAAGATASRPARQRRVAVYPAATGDLQCRRPRHRRRRGVFLHLRAARHHRRRVRGSQRRGSPRRAGAVHVDARHRSEPGDVRCGRQRGRAASRRRDEALGQPLPHVRDPRGRRRDVLGQQRRRRMRRSSERRDDAG